MAGTQPDRAASVVRSLRSSLPLLIRTAEELENLVLLALDIADQEQPQGNLEASLRLNAIKERKRLLPTFKCPVCEAATDGGEDEPDVRHQRVEGV